MSPKLFPLTVLVLYLGAAVCYGRQGNWKEAVYSALAAGLNFVVYFWR